MATLTKSLLPISGYTNQYYTYQCTVTENSYSTTNNTSNVTIAFYIKGPWNPSFYEWVTYYGIVVDGSVKKTGSSSPYVTTSNLHLLTWTGDIAHNSDGTKSINVGVYLYHSGPANYLPQQYSSGSPLSMGSVTLTTIPRASSFGTISGNTIGSSMTVNISRHSTSFTHQLWYKLGNSAWYDLGTGIGTSKTFTVSNDLLSQLPSATSGTLQLCVRTYNGNTQIGSDVYKNITVYVANSVVPTVGTITLNPADINEQNILVQGKNKITVSVSGCKAGTGSSIKSYTFSGPGVSSTTTSASVTSSGTISNTGTLTYTVKVTDNRGRTASKTATITCYAYTAPYIKPFSAYRCNSSGTADENGSYVKCNYTLGYSSVNNTNNVTVKIMYKKNTASSYSSVTSLTNNTAKSGSQLLSSISNASTYTIYATITDKYGGSSQSTSETIFSVSRVFNITSDGTGIALGKMAESNNTLDVKWQIKTDEPEQTMQNLSYRGHNLVSTTADDTTTQWGSKKNLATTFYTTNGQINNQPSQYGFLLNLTNGDKEVHQLWATQSSGSLLHRGGNASGWNGSWKEVLDSSNYTKFVPLTDYVVEQGTSGDFRYRKWNSGVSEAWYYKSLGQISLTTTKANGVWSNDTYQAVNVNLPSGLFSDAPTATGNVCSNGYTCLQVSNSTSTMISYRIWAPYSSSPSDCVVSIQLIGRWK